MARLPGADPIYEVADLFRERCLTEGRSLLWPDINSWTTENAQALWDAFIGSPDTSDKSFYEKWKDQLSEEPADIHRLAADLVVLYNLYPMNYWSSWKQTQVRRVAAWKLGQEPPDLDAIIPAFDAGGIGNAGPYYNLGRPSQYAFYLKFAQNIVTAGIDPHNMEACQAVAFATNQEVPHACNEAKNIMLHLLFPEHFERIASDNHKQKIVQAYGDLTAGETDVDLALAAIKKQLVTITGRPDLDFYESDIRKKWDPQGETVPKYWKVAPGDQASIWEECREGGFIAMGWDELGDLSGISKEEFGKRSKRLQALHRGEQGWSKAALEQTWKFSRIRPGDVVVANRGTTQVIGIGEVTGPYRFASDKAYYRHELPVDWSDTTPRTVDEPGWKRTLVKLSEEKFKKIRDGSVAPTGPAYWIEKTIVHGRPDRLEGDYALGRALWSPQRSKDGSDIYTFMRDVSPGDRVLHLTDNVGFTGQSVVAGGPEEFDGVPNTEWGGRPCYLVQLNDFEAADPSLTRDTFFSEPYLERLQAIVDSGVKSLFYSRKGELNQGAYLTPAPPELLDVLDDAYRSVAGRRLTHRPERHSWVFQSSPKYYDVEAAVKALPQLTWLVTAHKDKIKPGDRVFLAETGANAGVIALATVTEGPAEMPDDEGSKPFRKGDPKKFEGVQLRVRLRRDKYLDERITRQALLANPILRDSPAAQGLQGTNFALTPEQATALEELCGTPPHLRSVNPLYPLADFAKEVGLDEQLLRRWEKAIERKGQAIFYGPPGTGKTYVAEKMGRHLIGGGTGFSELVQFHPSYAYEDFIQGIRPSTDSDGDLRYEVMRGRFLEFCDKASATDDRCVLIIDEINRANLSRVFGELMYLLEYRNRKAPLAGGGTLVIPENVRLIGTMNTADRSIALVDHALRRRFAFLALRPDYEVLRRYHAASEQGFPTHGLAGVLKRVNQQINDVNYEIGITFFLREDLRDQIADIWHMEIVPYLEEYFFDQPEKVADFMWEKIGSEILQ